MYIYIYIYTGHNTYLVKTNKLKQEHTNTMTCSCPKAKKDSCVLGGKCILQEIVYLPIVKEYEKNLLETYIGLTADLFKIRYENHLKSFRPFKYSNYSDLSKHIWKLKGENKSYSITWKIIEISIREVLRKKH